MRDYYQAFDEVVAVLHAPYESASLFFRIFRGDLELNEKKNGWDSAKIGTGTNTGNGTWTVKAGKDAAVGGRGDTAIVYEYRNYQPNGSAIKIDGKIANSMYRSEGLYAECIGIYNETAANPVINTLTITGEYKAILKFTYINSDHDLKITSSNYDAKLFGVRGQIKGLFTELQSKIEFTYAGQTMKLDANHLKKLLRVAHKRTSIVATSKLRSYYDKAVEKFLSI